MTEKELFQAKSDTSKREEEVLAFWKENKTFEKSLQKRAPKGEFVFYDGPPFATGLPHAGSLLSSIIKDAIPRYKTMRGYFVRRRWGWDTHGLPIESLVEKKLGLKTKKDILDLGIDKFNEAARASVLEFEREWGRYVDRIGRWVDFKNSYKTMDNSYIESVWWALKKLWDKKLLYEGRRVLMYCPHCETPLAKAEIAMDNTYKDITEEAVTVRFRVKNPARHGLPDNTMLLAWTTTPWTLPGNVALAVGANISYFLVPEPGGMVIVAKERLLEILRGGVRPRVMVDSGKEFKGSELVGIEYEPLYNVPAVTRHPKRHMVLAADFVSTDEGTGIVHTAVMYGEDDFALGTKEGLPMVQLLNPNGTYNDDAPAFVRGKYIKEAEKDIKRDLESRGLLFEKKNHTHSYPHCYRCGTPLIYNAVPSWFIAINKVKEKMLSENEKVNWVPEHLKEGRFKNIVASAPDWTISRNRFWASPLPIWKEKGSSTKIGVDGTGVMVVGSLEEMKQRVKKSGNRYFVMRHGEAENNVQNIVSNDRDVYSLTAAGREQVTRAAENLARPTIIYASPIRRARESAEVAATVLGVDPTKIVIDDRLSEFDFGNLNNKPFAEFSAWRAQRRALDEALPAGESYLAAKKRFGAFLRGLEVKHQHETILIVSHGIALESLSAIVEGADEARSWDIINTESFPYSFVKELAYVPLPLNANYELDLHRPYTDSLILLDDKGREYERIPEVVDCWVESGAMPFAEYHYPFENVKEFEKRAPGNFIAEYIAQTRTWFYYMHAFGVLLFDRLAFKNVVSTGNVLADDGTKMSKSKGNYTDPLVLLDRFGADALRFYLLGSVVMQAEDFRFKDEELRDTHNRIVGMLWNSYKFFETYKSEYDGHTQGRSSPHVLDRWIFARLDQCTADVTTALDAFDTPRTCRFLREFLEDYSTWYVRRSRERAKSEVASDKQSTLATQREVLLTFARLVAPVMPFIAESIWRGAGGAGESVHLAGWPEVPRVWFRWLFGAPNTPKILEEMRAIRAIVSQTLEARDKAGIRVRQPLARLTVYTVEQVSDDMRALIADEVNVKEVLIKKGDGAVELDTIVTPELKEEGFVREFIRAVQSLRKEQGLHPSNSVHLEVRSLPETRRLIEEHAETVKNAAHVSSIALGDIDGKEYVIGGEAITLRISKK